MAVGTGYSKIASSGLVFAYDADDNFNSYRGQPGTNITTGVNRNYNGYNKDVFSNGYYFETNGYTETVNIPALGLTTVQSININNVYCGYGCNGNYNCCPNLFNYTGGWNSSIWTGNTTYTYQIIYKCVSGYTNPNFMYHYEYNSSGGYLTEYGVFTTAQQESLGDGWYHAWNTFTTQPTAALGYTGLWYYQYNTPDKVSIAAVSIVPGTTIRPPREFIPSGTTRTNTQGLLDISGGGSTLTLNNSYDSNAQFYFDGVSNYIDTGKTASQLGMYGASYTAECVCYPTSFSGDKNMFGTDQTAYRQGLHLTFRSGAIYMGHYSSDYSAGSGTLNAWNHIVFRYDASTGAASIFKNGVLQGTGNIASFIGTTNILIGREFGGGSTLNFAGQINVSKIYNRVLSDGEILQNYGHYKTRFNLP